MIVPEAGPGFAFLPFSKRLARIDIQEANASLIIAAPEMLDALHFITQAITDAINTEDAEAKRRLINLCGSRALQAIAKAEGRE